MNSMILIQLFKHHLISILLLILIPHYLIAAPPKVSAKEKYKLYILIKKNKTQDALDYINQNPSINTLTYKGRTPLLWAIENNQPKVVEALINTGVNTDASHKKIPPLLFSMYKENDKVSEVFIQKSLSLWDFDQSNTTPLIFATTTGNVSIARQILDKNKKGLQLKDNTNRTALDWALINEDLPMISLLLNHGAQIDPKSDNAYWFKYLEKGKKELISKLLEPVINVNILSPMGQTPLTFAAKKGNTALTKILIQKKVNLNMPNEFGKYPINIAINSQHRSYSRFLIESGADVNIKDIEGWTPLMLTSALGFSSLTELIISKKPKLNLQDNSGKTALLYACVNGYESIAKKLIRAGASTDIEDSDGHDCSDLAEKEGHSAIIRLVEKAN